MQFDPPSLSTLNSGVFGSNALAAVKCNLLDLKKPRPSLRYVICIGQLKTLNLYRKPLVLQLTVRRVSCRAVRLPFWSVWYTVTCSSCSYHVPLPVTSSHPICFVCSWSANKMARFEYVHTAQSVLSLVMPKSMSLSQMSMKGRREMSRSAPAIWKLKASHSPLMLTAPSVVDAGLPSAST